MMAAGGRRRQPDFLASGTPDRSWPGWPAGGWALGEQVGEHGNGVGRCRWPADQPAASAFPSAGPGQCWLPYSPPWFWADLKRVPVRAVTSRLGPTLLGVGAMNSPWDARAGAEGPGGTGPSALARRGGWPDGGTRTGHAPGGMADGRAWPPGFGVAVAGRSGGYCAEHSGRRMGRGLRRSGRNAFRRSLLCG